MTHSKHASNAPYSAYASARRAAQRLARRKRCSAAVKCGLSLAVSAALAASMSAALPALAFADMPTLGSDVLEQIDDALQGQQVDTFSYASKASKGTFSTKSSATSTGKSSTKLKTKYDLRDPNGDGNTKDSVVTSVKSQAPWGTCWGFSAIAACETSIKSEAATLGQSKKYADLDLSELELAQFVYKNGGAPAYAAGEAQAGEGYHTTSSDPNKGLDIGGMMEYAGNLFAGGVGPLDEGLAHYRNKEGIIYCQVTRAGSTTPTSEYLTQDEITALEAKGATVVKWWYAGNFLNSKGEMVYPDWSVSDEDWATTSYEFENANVLPNTSVKYANGNFKSLDMDAVNAIKSEIQNYGRAVSCTFYADTSHPDDETGVAKYINTKTWAHFTYDNPGVNHGVTIIGWDDNYSKKNFTNKLGKLPEGNGAWLVKNSWGSEEEEFPNNQSKRQFGIENSKGQHTGYFWISYYDRSITNFETFDFDLAEYSDNENYVIDQYDFMPQAQVVSIADTVPTSSANVFAADFDMVLRTISSEVAKPNTKVTYQIYLLDDEATTPDDADHSTLVYKSTKTYEYGGYHRVTLDAADWVALREGQRYAIVTTQLCKDDGKYYTCAGMNSYKPTAKMIAAYTKQQTQVVYNDYYNDHYSDCLESYKAQGLDDKEAKKKAQDDTDAWIATSEVKAEMQAETDDYVDVYKNSYFDAKVNAGESYSNSASCLSGNTSKWFDWSLISNSSTLRNSRGVAIDNLPIKGIGELVSWASVEQLSDLEATLESSKAVLDNAVGSDTADKVPTSMYWLTKAEYKKLSEAVKTATALMKQAGKDYKTTLTNVTPTSDEVTAAVEALEVEPKAGTGKDFNTVKAAKAKVAIKVGKKTTVKIKGAQGALSVATSAKKVAKASCKGGKVVIKGLKKGKATITVKAAGDANHQAGSVKIKVTVKK